MNSLRLWVLGVGTMTSFAALEAHVLWINVTPGDDAERTLVTSIGYGHVIPGDEILLPDWGPIELATYEIIAPDAARSSLGVPHLTPTAKTPYGREPCGSRVATRACARSRSIAPWLPARM